MAGNNNPIGLEFKTSIALVVRGVTKEHTQGGAGRKFVSRCGGHMGKAGAAEHTKMFIGGLCGMRELNGVEKARVLVGSRFTR